ncbi:MAG TPA: MEDS domain-containing protein [Dehalococcoidia bacterium]|nr:MEDS domain-containing protein [Dehalococcoidia bacterium]
MAPAEPTLALRGREQSDEDVPMRRRINVDDAGILRPRDHVAWFAAGQEELYTMAVPALAEGLRRGEKLMFIAEEPEPNRLTGVGDVDQLLAGLQLEVLQVDAVYCRRPELSASALLDAFEAALRDARAGGFSGIRVVADNTPLVRGSDEEFDHWLAWEQVADRFQSDSAVTGICFFNTSELTRQRQDDLAALHPVRSTGDVEPRFSLFADGDAVFVVGAVDAAAAEQLRRLLSVSHRELVVDLSAAHLMDEQALLAIAQVATTQRPLRVRGNAGLKERLAAVSPTGSSLRIEQATGSEARCARCGDVIGSYEEAVLVLQDGIARTSLVADPDRFAAAVARYHGGCYDG